MTGIRDYAELAAKWDAMTADPDGKGERERCEYQSVIDCCEIAAKEAVEACVAAYIKRGRMISRNALECVLDALTDDHYEEVSRARTKLSDLGWTPEEIDWSRFLDKQMDRMCEELGGKPSAGGASAAEMLFQALKPPSREQMEKWRSVPLNPATPGFGGENE